MKTRVHDQSERVDGLEPGRVFPTVRAALEAFQDLPVETGQEEPTPDGDAEGLDNADSDQENH